VGRLRGAVFGEEVDTVILRCENGIEMNTVPSKQTPSFVEMNLSQRLN